MEPALERLPAAEREIFQVVFHAVVQDGEVFFVVGALEPRPCYP